MRGITLTRATRCGWNWARWRTTASRERFISAPRMGRKATSWARSMRKCASPSRKRRRNNLFNHHGTKAPSNTIQKADGRNFFSSVPAFFIQSLVNIELINTGSELMLGRVLNTHQQWICRRLADLGYIVARQVAVPDTAQAIQQSVREALNRADLVIVTGGLGPTSDDITRELIAQLLGKKLQPDDK